MRVAVTRSFPGNETDRLRAFHDVDIWPERRPLSSPELYRFAADADAAITMLTDRIDASFFDACPRIRVVANVAVGYDNIDVAEATRRGIPVANTPGVLTEATADLAWALILGAARRVVEAAEAVKAGRWVTWEPDFMLGVDVAGGVLGIIGMGKIGSAVARRASGFGMDVISHRPWALDDVLELSDVVSIHVPLTEETRGLIGERELSLMKRTAVLVNTARGPVVDQRALHLALREGWIGAAGLDVVVEEPIQKDDALLSLPNCIVLPHIGSATVATRRRMMALAVDNVLAALAGEPMPSVVNPEVL